MPPRTRRAAAPATPAKPRTPTKAVAATSAAKPTAAKPTATKPAAAKPAAAKPAAAEPAARSAGTKAAGTKAAGTKAAGTKAAPRPRRRSTPPPVSAPVSAVEAGTTGGTDPTPTADALADLLVGVDAEAESIPEPLPTPRRPGLIPTDIADALARVLTAATSAIRAHEAGSRDGANMENVHQMRVATRRIRAYLKAAGPALDAASAGSVRADLKELADALGAVRDLDVMIQRMHTEAAALGGADTAALEQLIGALDDDRGTARGSLVAVLDDPTHHALLGELDRVADAPPVIDPWADLQELAAGEWRKLAKGRSKLHRTFGEHPPDDDLHALRILGKRARYTAELLPRDKKTQAYLTALAGFQEVLGDHQDATVLEDSLRDMVARTDTGSGAAALAAGRVIERCRERKMKARSDYPAAWAAVAKAAAAFD